CLKSGTLPFLESAARWYARRYGLELDPKREALSLIGSQEGLAHLLMAVADPGAVLLMPEVAYPVYFGAAKVAGLEIFPIPLGPDRLPVLSA
ncbi:aminotransferase class I/II-fold pyridoxal phosphate-dependent enzyme, partial [Escherichia coli]|nr:aminotransferase class I/II-fold pyridoxal phosphate-dependent enzyme [Escherichia coli]